MEDDNSGKAQVGGHPFLSKNISGFDFFFQTVIESYSFKFSYKDDGGIDIYR